MTDEFPEPVEDVEKVQPEELRDKVEAGEDFVLLDVRAKNEHEEWAIELEEGDSYNYPYFELLDGLTEELRDKLRDEKRDIIVVCAKGGSSEYIASIIKQELDKDAKNLAEGMNGWAKIYESNKLQLENGELVQYHRPSSGCLSYMVKSNGEAAVIDPLRAFANRYVEDAGDNTLKYAIDTHIHADHLSGVRKLEEIDDVIAVVPEAARGRNVTYIDDIKSIEDGETLNIGDIEIKAVHTPGHTTGMTSYMADEEVLLTGDGLFIESVARPDLEKGDEGAEEQAGQLYESLQKKVLTLPDDMYVGAAHLSDGAEPVEKGLYMKTIGQIKEDLEPLQLGKDEFVEYIISDMPPRPSNFEDIIPTNKGEQEASDEEAFEMELGPNNCAATKGKMD